MRNMIHMVTTMQSEKQTNTETGITSNNQTFIEGHLELLSEVNFESVTGLAEKIWKLHYAAIVSNEQIEYMLAERFSSENLSKYINSDRRWFELLWFENQLVGYCSYSHISESNEMKLEQLYLLKSLRGKGLGGFMLRHVEAETRKRNIKKLMLQVNKRNNDSVSLYKKAGFKVRKEAIFDIGNGFVMDDYVMEKTLINEK